MRNARPESEARRVFEFSSFPSIGAMFKGKPIYCHQVLIADADLVSAPRRLSALCRQCFEQRTIRTGTREFPGPPMTFIPGELEAMTDLATTVEDEARDKQGLTPLAQTRSTSS